VSRDALKDGGTFTWPVNEMPVNFNYGQLNGGDLDEWIIDAAFLPRTFTVDANATPHWDPDYLASDPILTRDPKQVVTYRINPKAIWYDGTPITWQDFYWQWKAMNGTDKRYQISSANGYEDIENVERGKDEREVVVTFKHHYADWQAVFNPVYPASTNKSPDVFNDGWKARPLTSAGPFKFGSIDQTAKTVTLVRNEKWWGNPAKLDRIVYRFMDRNAEVDALANGEIDTIDISPDADRYHRATNIGTVDIRAAAGPNFNHVTFNATSAVLQDVNVRQAIAMSIDRDAMARAMVGPLGIEARPLNNHIFMTNQVGYQDNSGAVGKYDPAKAGQMLDAAGWKLQGGVRQKDGRPLQINFVIPSGLAASRQEAELIQNMLGQVGVRLLINTVPTNEFFDKFITAGQFDMTTFAWIGTPFPISSAKSIYVKPTKGPNGQLIIQQNYARVGSDEIDQLFDQAASELDHQKAIAIANRADALIWQEVHSIPLFQRPDLWAVNKNVANFGAFGFADRVYQDIGWIK
jgi:peptide/nickel transport system substrate-binding protein